MPASESPSLVLDTRRKSLRAKKMKNSSFHDDLPASVLAATGMVERDGRLPEGWNPSDDSEDDYTPPVKTAGGRKRGKDDTSDEDEIVDNESYKKSRATGGRKSVSGRAYLAKVKPEPGSGSVNTCVLCHVEVESSSANANLKFHYAQEHYYPTGSFAKIAPAEPEDIMEGQLLPRDVAGKVYRYVCEFQPCTQRRMGYKELVLHLATQHQQLRVVMEQDTRPEVAAVLAYLYPKEPMMISNVKEEKFAISKVKQEKFAVNYSLENEDSEDVDDPNAKYFEATRSAFSNHKIDVKPKIKSVKGFTGPRIDKIHNCLICDAKDGKNLNLGSGIQDLRYHYSVCFYNQGGYAWIVDPGKDNVDELGRAIEEYGKKFKYTCPIASCPKNQGRVKSIGFKEYCIHAGVAHHMVERAMAGLVARFPAMAEVLQAVAAAREAEGGVLEDLPPVQVEEMHTCLLCGGKDKDGTNLSFEGSKLWQTRYHYASCYYESGVYLALYTPGAQNIDEKGQPKDILGKDVKYSCTKAGCAMKRRMGFKEFSIHMANDHGGLETVMMEDEREEVRRMVEKLKKN